MKIDSEKKSPVHDAFISYSRKNKGFAKKLEKALENYKPPKDLNVPRRHLNIFLDEADFTGVEYYQAVEEALKSSTKLIVLCSPDARQSSYVNDEIRRFAKANGMSNVIPVLIGGIPNNEATPGKEDEMAFPEALCEMMTMPLGINYLAFDLESDKLNKGIFANSWFTLLANIYNVSRDTIEQREMKRRARALRIGISLASGICIVLLIALILTLISRREAVEQRKIAVEQREKAVEQRREAVKQRKVAESQRRIAVSRQLAAQARIGLRELGHQLPLWTLLAAESVRIHPSWEGLGVLRECVALLPQEIDSLHFGDDIYTIAFSPNGQYLGSVSRDGIAVIWDVANHNALQQFYYQEPLKTLAFASNNTLFAVGSKGGTIAVYDVQQGRELVRFDHSDEVTALAFSDNGKYFATAGKDGTYRVIAVGAWREAKRVDVQAEVVDVKFTPNSRFLLTLSTYGTVRVLDTETMDEVSYLTNNGTGLGLAIHPKGEHVAAIIDNSVRVWNLSDEEEIARMEHSGAINPSDMAHFSWLNDAAFNHDGTYLATAGRDGTARVWQPMTGEEVLRLTHNHQVMAVAFSPDGQSLATVGTDNTARLWELVNRREIARMVHENVVDDVVFHPDGRLCATKGLDFAIRMWGTLQGQKIAQVDHKDSVRNVVTSMDGSVVASLDADRNLMVWAIQTGEVHGQIRSNGMRKITLSSNGEFAAFSSFKGLGLFNVSEGTTTILARNRDIFELAMNPRYLALLQRDGTVSVWETGGGRKLPESPASPAYRDLTISRDGQYLIVESENKRLDIFKLPEFDITGKIVAELDPMFIGMSTDGNYIAATRSRHVDIWQLPSGEKLNRLSYDYEEVDSLLFHPDGQRLITVTQTEVRLWEIATGRVLQTFTSQDGIRRLRLSRDGNYMVRVGENRLALWELSSGRKLIQQSSASIADIQFSPDGRYLVIGRTDNRVTVTLWQFEDLLETACSRLNRYLTQNEWNQYLGDLPYNQTCKNLSMEKD